MNQYELTGGARIGMANATFPFAKLRVSQKKLELKVSLLGNLVFSPKDIISIEPHYQMPIIGRGLRINHRVPNYKKKVIFWTFKSPDDVLMEIRKTGFLESVASGYSIEDPAILAKQNQGGFPMKKAFTIGAVVVWNLLFAIDFIGFSNNSNNNFPIGNGIKTAIGLLLGAAILTLVSKAFRTLILKEGRELDDVKGVLYLIIVICCFFMLVISTVPGRGLF
ncbi:MAG: hypothetical protein ACI8YQ_005155 [Polaribacter sp.]|jgi:hypothetical protein